MTRLTDQDVADLYELAVTSGDDYLGAAIMEIKALRAELADTRSQLYRLGKESMEQKDRHIEDLRAAAKQAYERRGHLADHLREVVGLSWDEIGRIQDARTDRAPVEEGRTDSTDST